MEPLARQLSPERRRPHPEAGSGRLESAFPNRLFIQVVVSLFGLELQRELSAAKVWKPKFVCKITYVYLHSWDLAVLQKTPHDLACFQCASTGDNLLGHFAICCCFFFFRVY